MVLSFYLPIILQNINIGQKAELNGLFQVESINGKVILPIWHNLTKKQVVEYSPIIADRKAMTTASMTAEEIAVQLKELFMPEATEKTIS